MQSLIREVGIKRIVKYFFYSLWQVGFNALLFSPLRILWMQLAGAKIGHNCFIDAIDFFNLDRTGIKGITIGNNCFIGRRVLLDLAGKMELGNYVTIAPNATILTHINVGLKGHPLLAAYPPKISHTRIADGSFIGTGSIVVGGATIGEKVMIGAGTVVRGRIHSRHLVVGKTTNYKKKIT